MSTSPYRPIILQGLWKNNPALVQILGLCPLLAVSNSAVNALSLGMATVCVMGLSSLCVSLIRNHVTSEIRLPVFVMVIASTTTCIELAMQAITYELYQSLGIFIPLIVTNCAVLGRADSFASKHHPTVALLDGLMMGSGFALVLLLLGILRELLGQGTLFNDLDLLLGPIAQSWSINLAGDSGYRFLLAVLPPGAFMLMGLMIATKNHIDTLVKEHAPKRQIAQGSKRVRTTG